MKTHLTLFAICAFVFSVHAQKKQYWRPVTLNETSKGKNLFEGISFIPSAYKLFQLDEKSLKRDLQNVPVENKNLIMASTSLITVPTAEGNTEQFKIVESSVMQPKLAARYPGIKTYIGKGIERPDAEIRFAYTTLGFFATVASADKPKYYINCLDKNENIYIVNAYNVQDKTDEDFRCSVDGSSITGKPEGLPTPFKGNADDGKLRTYVLALCTTGEFSRYFMTGSEVTTEDSLATVMSALTTTLIRVNGIYERDFSIRLVFTEKEDDIIFLNPATDPFTTFKAPELNSASQQSCDTKIGFLNYDIGHVVHRGASQGNAGCIGCVCKAGSKGSGWTIYTNPKLDYFVDNYLSHEFGHQFGGNHIFTFSNEGTGANVEPGSGSTVMGYAGITGNTDIQDHGDPYFSAVNIAQISNYIKTGFGATCDEPTETGNSAPSLVTPLNDYTIPRLTPFQIKGEFTDNNAGDILTYTVEQIDRFVNGQSNTIPNAFSKEGPLFRSVVYTTNPYRNFPNLATILAGQTKNGWEVLPNVTRTMNFRITASDNHAGGSNNKSADMEINAIFEAGPFSITVLNAAISDPWIAGETDTVKWNIAKTDIAPVNCANVKISLSTDGGVTFPYVLAASTPNDGEEPVIVPSVNSTTARIKVEAVDNIFFDINNANFRIESTVPVTWLSFTAQKISSAAILLNWSTTNESNNMYYDIERSSDAVSFEKISLVNAGNAPSGIQEYQYTDYKAIAGANYYRLKQVDADGKSSYSSVAKVILPTDIQTWSVQPNPATTATTLLARKEMSNVQISLTDANGKTVYKVKYTKLNAGQQVIIPLHNLAKGMYVLSIHSSEGLRAEKISKQ